MTYYLLLNVVQSFFDREYMGEKVSSYLWFVGIIAGTLLLKKPMAAALARISSAITTRYSYLTHKDTVRTMLIKPIDRLLQIVLYFIAVNQLSNILESVTLHKVLRKKQAVDINLGDVVDHVFLLLFILSLTQVIARFIDFIYYLRMGKAQAEKNHSRIQLLPLTKEVAKLALWILTTFWILGSVFHVNVPALITGLGIGGVALALAGKETVENFFASFTILSDKPFQTGETIRIGDIEGVVERIGFRSTRLRSTDGSAYIIPNQNLVSQNLINLSMRDNRGIKVAVNIKYGISHDSLQQLMAELKKMLLAIKPIREPVDINIESFDKETFQLIISYNVPHPLPDNMKLSALKTEVNSRIFELVSHFGTIGTPVGTS